MQLCNNYQGISILPGQAFLADSMARSWQLAEVQTSDAPIIGSAIGIGRY